MRALVLPCALLLAGCVVYETPPPPRPVYFAPPPQAPAPRVISQQQAVDIGFRLAQDRGLEVNFVHHAHLDSSGRWHVDLRGRDRALMLLDGRDGKLLKGHFRNTATAAQQPPPQEPGPQQPAPQQAPQQQAPPVPKGPPIQEPPAEQGAPDQSPPSEPGVPDDAELEG